MKKYLSSLIILLLLVTQITCTGVAGKSKQKSVEWNTPEELLSQMTLAEKVGQMTQAERAHLQKGDIEKYFIGSVLSGGGSNPWNNTPLGWLNMVNGFVEESLKTRLGIPVVYGIDAVHGHNNVKGADMYMASDSRDAWISYINNLINLVEEGTVPMSRIDDAVIRILRFKQSISLFEKPLTVQAGEIGTDVNRAAARSLVSDSLVLLRNENNTLKKLSESKKILVAGQGANDIGMQCGGWTISWQGSHHNITNGEVLYPFGFGI